MAAIICRIPRDPRKGTSIKVVGHPGPGCKDLTAALERAIGIQVADQETDEFYQEPQQQEQQLLEGE